MEVRLNKLISDSGLCSRREADKFIEEGRVTVNGSLPQVGQKVTEADIVMLDDIQIKIGKNTGKQTSSARINIQELELAGQEKKAKKTKPLSTATSEKKAASPATGSKGLRPGKYVKYNKYAAARHAARNGESPRKETKASGIDKEMLKEALRPKFGKSLGRSALHNAWLLLQNRLRCARQARTTRSTRQNALPPAINRKENKTMGKKHIVLVTGGQRSGKSGYAQKLALSLTANPVYLATSRVWDEEFHERVLRHQADRGPEWTNIEEEKYLSRHDLNGRVVVIDCVTLWGTNFFFDNEGDTNRSLVELKEEFNKLTEQDAYLIFVTNEIGLGGVSPDAVQRRFTDLQGWLNQYIASRADEVVFMVSGIPMKVK